MGRLSLTQSLSYLILDSIFLRPMKSIGLIVLSLMISGPAVGDESSGKNYHRLFAEIMKANAKAITECKNIAKSRPPPSDHVVRQLLAIKKAHLYSFIRYSHDRATFLCEQRHGAYPAEYLYFLKADDNLPVDLKTQVSLYAELVSDPALLDRFNLRTAFDDVQSARESGRLWFSGH